MSSPARDPLRSARALVTGASGFIGGHVVTALVRRGAEVAALCRDPSRHAVPGHVTPLAVDVAVPGALAAAVAAWRPDVVFHLAGYGVARTERDPDSMQRVNADTVVELVDALAATPTRGWAGLRLVHTGSAFEYGPLEGPLDESRTCRPTTAYGVSKLAGTAAVCAAVRAGRLPALVARLFTVFGPGERPGRLFPTLLEARAGDGPIPLSTGEQRRDFTFVDDVADALLELACTPAERVLDAAAPFDRGVVNVASGRLHPVRAFVERAAHVLGIAPARLAFGAVAQLPEDVPMEPVPVARLAAALGAALPGELDHLLARAVSALGDSSRPD